MKKKIMVLLLMILCISNKVQAIDLNETFTEPIAPGLSRHVYTVKGTTSSAYISVLKVDLNNPNLKIDLIAGEGKYNNKATVSKMAANTNATAMVNGDFFNMALEGTPEGPSIVHGKVQTSPCVMTDVYSLGIDENNTASILQIGFEGSVTAPNGASFKLDGLNKSYYWYEPDKQYSHQDKLQLYNDFWAAKTRGDKKNSEILLSNDGTVEEISEGKNFPYPVPDGKSILQADGKAYEFIKNNVQVGQKLNVQYNLTPRTNFKFLVGGHALLVDNGAKVKYTKDINVLGGVRARTAAGITQDGKTLYIVSGEGRTKRSTGMTLDALSEVMVGLGAYRAVNLDGGGSTAQVVKNLGEINQTRVIDPEGQKAERKVVNGIGFYNIAPVTGNISGVKMKGPSTLLIGQTGDFGIKGAYDDNLHPIDLNTIGYSMGDISSDVQGIWNSYYYMPLTPGSVEVILTTSTGVSTSKQVQVLGEEGMKTLILSTENRRVAPGSTIQYKLIAKNNSGEKVEISPRVSNFTIEGFTGVADSQTGTVVVENLNGLRIGTVKATIGSKVAEEKIFDINSRVMELKIGDKNYSLDGQKSKMDVSPFIQNDRTMVPIRFILEGFSGEVNWDDENKIVTIVYNGNTIELPIGASTVSVNGENRELDSPAVINGDRTFVPIRFIMENCGMEVDYIHEGQQVFIAGDKIVVPPVEPVAPVENVENVQGVEDIQEEVQN